MAACAGLALAAQLAPLAGHAAASCAAPPLRGFNLIQDERAPLDSAQAAASLRKLRDTGANTVAIVPFLWQPNADSPQIGRGSDMSDVELTKAIRTAHRLGLSVLVKPHVWVPGTWAGEVRMNTEEDWAAWFWNYGQAMLALAAVAQREHAEGLVIGTEIDQSLDRPEWPGLIARVRAAFHGKLLYAAHGAEGAERVPFWDKLDAIGATSYPPLGADDAPGDWRNAMNAEVDRLLALSKRFKRRIFIAEIGIRSAVGAAAKPWESAEERTADVDEALQADVIAAWLDALSNPAVESVLVWRWISDPDSGGSSDTDFTVQNKRAEQMLARRWRACGLAAAR